MKNPKERTNKPASLQACKDLVTMTAAAVDLAQLHVKTSAGNSKIGNTLNVSTAPIVTCGGACAQCGPHCYAVQKFLRLGKKPSNPWAVNTVIALYDLPRFIDELAQRVWFAEPDFFRWHVSGEILNGAYFAGMIRIANENPRTRFLAFTKRYDVVNIYCAQHGGRAAVPDNLQIVFSVWRGQPCENPYHFPECHVIFETGPQTVDRIPEGRRYYCPGQCEICQCAGAGCWFLRDGCAVCINEH